MSIRSTPLSAPVSPILRDPPHRWDAAVLASPHANFLQAYAWGRLKQRFDWVPVRLRLPVAAGSPLLAHVLFRRIPYAPYTLGYVPRGPILDYADEDAVDLMDRALSQLARRYRALAITWEPPVPDDSLLSARLLRRGFRPTHGVQARSTRVVDLRPSLEEIAAQQHHKWRYNTRLARRHGVRVRTATTADDLRPWYRLLLATAARDGFAVHSEEYYRMFWQETAPDGSTVLLLAEHEGRLLAGIIAHHFGPTATYLYGASGDEGRSLMPNHLLQWEAMCWARARGALAYDLFGIADGDDEDAELAGVTRFKAGFGGRVVRYAAAFDRIYHPALYALAQRLRDRA